MTSNRSGHDPRCICASRGIGGRYPVARPKRVVDERFTTAIVHEVGAVLETHGFPPVEDDSPDYYALLWVLTRFVYGVPGERSSEGSEGGGTGRGGALW